MDTGTVGKFPVLTGEKTEYLIYFELKNHRDNIEYPESVVLARLGQF
jgi:hypothetical protein